MSTITQEHLRNLEKACVGALIEAPEKYADLFYERVPLDHLGPGTFHIAKAIANMLTETEVAVTPQTVAEQMRTEGTLSIGGGASFIHDCWTYAQHTVDARFEIEALGRLYLLREAHNVGTRLQQATKTMDAGEWVQFATDEVDRIARAEAGTQPPVITTLRDVLTGEDLTPEWAIPGILPKFSATMLVAEEGIGKSTVLRQLGIAAMAGIQPFDPHREEDKYAPQRVVLVDCEVSANQLKRSLRSLWSYARQFAPDADTTMLAVESQQAGLDLTQPHDQAWLHRVVRTHRADMLVIGPVYRFADTNINEEEGVRPWQRAFEPLQAEGCAIVMEHHAPNGMGGANRPLRPIGSSAIRRWIAQGISLRGDRCETHRVPFCQVCIRKAKVEAWRGAREDEARWPRFLVGEEGRLWWVRDEFKEITE